MRGVVEGDCTGFCERVDNSSLRNARHVKNVEVYVQKLERPAVRVLGNLCVDTSGWVDVHFYVARMMDAL